MQLSCKYGRGAAALIAAFAALTSSWPNAAREARALPNDGGETPPYPGAPRALPNDGGETPPYPGAPRALPNDGGETPPYPGAPSAQADVSVDLRAGIYQDTDHTFISTNAIAARALLNDTWTFKGRYLADVVSSASVDVVSAATAHFDELRHEVEGGVAYGDGTSTASLTYVFSDENDWTSHSARASVARDWLGHQLTLGLALAVTWNEVGRSGDRVFREELLQGTGSLDATWTASRNDLVSVTYTAIGLSGYQSSPYRFVRIQNATVPALPIASPEAVPEERIRHAVGLRWNHHVGRDSALRLQARGYLDDWGVLSGTLGAEYTIGFGPLDVGAHVRGYFQDRADFYAPLYETRYRFMTADRELATFGDVFGGLRAALRLPVGKAFKELRADARADGFYFHFIDFPRLPRRFGVTAEIGLGATF